jgi:hypothetical protein
LTIFRATLTIVAEPQTIFWGARKMVPAVRNIFSFGQTMFCGIPIIVWMIQTVFTTTETIVTAPMKMVSIAPTMVCKVLSL